MQLYDIYGPPILSLIIKLRVLEIMDGINQCLVSREKVRMWRNYKLKDYELSKADCKEMLVYIFDMNITSFFLPCML